MTVIDPGPPPAWVTFDDLRAILGPTVDPDRGQGACDAANGAIVHRLASGQDLDKLTADPLLHLAAVTAAVDFYRRPGTPAGVFQSGELFARLPADFYTSIDAAITASGAQLAGGFA